jgi:hypothetical protein
LYSDVPFQLNLGNGLLHSTSTKNLNRQDKTEHHSKPIHITRHINTGIIYLPLPEPRLQFVKPQQSFDFKHQIEQDFYIRYRCINNDEFDQMFNNIKENDASRYKISYHHLYESVLKSILNSIDLNEEISQVKHSILYENEILPVLIHNHKLAKREKKFLYNVVTKVWQKFDECIQSEVNVQDQLEQIKKEHQALINMKIKQEQYQTFYFKSHEINNEIIHLKRGLLS